jgi:fermentation-respiration switch protein FrsA (DUF1100 family)
VTRYRTGETLIFVVATTLMVVHALDDAVVHRQAGVGLSQHALAAVISVCAGLAGVVAFPRLRPGLRAALSFGFGVLALVNGLLHLRHVTLDGPAASDVTGVLAAGAGAVLIGLAIAIPWRHRGEGAATPKRRWAHRAVAVPVGLVAAIVVLGPIAIAITETHKYREPVGAAPSAAYERVGFSATDGLDLAGWYRPSRNGAAVLLVHGGGGDRTGAQAHAQLLARHGYGVLLYDARGRGDSEGSPNSYGWGWEKDAAGALDFLGRRGDVEPGRIGALGLSTGADILIDTAARRDDIAALVTDGAAALSFEDWHRLRAVDIAEPSGWVMFSAIRVLSGDSPGPALEDQVARIASPLLLISAGHDVERDFNVDFAHAASAPVEHWNLPEAQHTAAIRQRPAEYERRVVAFFDRALLR